MRRDYTLLIIPPSIIIKMEKRNKNGRELVICSISWRVNYLSAIIKKSGLSSAHVCKLIKRLEADDITAKEKVGRKKMIKLTEKGERIKELYHQLNSELCRITHQKEKK